MELKRFICPNCGASINYEENQPEVTCEYCGSKFSTGVKAQPNAEQNGYDFEKGRQRAMMEQQPVYNIPPQQPVKKNSYLWLWIMGWTCCFPIPLTVLIWKSQKLNNKWKTGLTIGLWGFLLLWGKIGGSSSNKRSNDSESQLRLGVSSFEVINEYYEDVVTKFESNGFTNITIQEIKNDEELLAGKVSSVSVNGNTDFNSFDNYPAEAKIVVRYYSTIELKDEKDNDNKETDTTKTSGETGKVSLDVFNNLDSKPEKNYDETKEIVENGYHISLPEYYEWNNEKNEKSVAVTVESGTVFYSIKTNYEKASNEKEINEALDALVDNILSSFESRVVGVKDYKSGKNTDLYGNTVEWYSLYECDHATKQVDGSDTYIASIFTLYFNEVDDSIIMLGLLFSDSSQYYHVTEYENIIKSVYYAPEDSDTKSENNETTKQEETTNSTTETKEVEETSTESTTAATNDSVYEYAYSREYDDYTICYLIDTDTKECIMFMTSDGYGYYGQYTGDLSSQIIVNYPREGYSDTITFQNGLGSDADVRIGDDTKTFEFKNVAVSSVDKYLKSIHKD